jgi:predicted Zn-dependent protease
MNKNFVTKLVASIWLFAIILSVIWTWIIIIFSTDQTQAPSDITQEELNKILQNYNTWTTKNNSWEVDSGSVLNLSQTWTIVNTWIINK